MKKRNTLGFILILLGVVFLLDNLGYLEFGLIFDKYWPMVLIIFGVVNLFRERSGKVFSLLLILVGSFLQLDRLDIFLIDIWDLFVPALLIIGGIGIIINKDNNRYEEEFEQDDSNKREKYEAKKSSNTIEDEENIIDEETIIDEENSSRDGKKDFYEENDNSFSNDLSYDDYIDLSCAFTERRLSNKSDNFKGGKISSVIATAIIDLRDVNFYENKAIIDVNSILGNVEILVPENCRVEISGTPILGGWNNYTRVNRENEKSVLRIRALIVLGGIDIR